MFMRILLAQMPWRSQKNTQRNNFTFTTLRCTCASVGERPTAASIDAYILGIASAGVLPAASRRRHRRRTLGQRGAGRRPAHERRCRHHDDGDPAAAAVPLQRHQCALHTGARSTLQLQRIGTCCHHPL